MGGVKNYPEYGIWEQMKNRCYRPATASFKYYGARGVKVCDRWLTGEGGKTGFECFVEDMGWRPAPHLTLDRKNNAGDYEPGNCRWATPKEQAANRRPRSPNLNPYPIRKPRVTGTHGGRIRPELT